jgi:hypothetical protein
MEWWKAYLVRIRVTWHKKEEEDEDGEDEGRRRSRRSKKTGQPASQP